MIGTIFCLSVMEAGAKYLTQNQPYEMVVWGRYLFHFLLTVPIFLTPATIGLVRTGRPAMHVLRSLFLAGGTLAGIGAISLMPLAEATALVFSAPLLVTLMSPWVLNEPVGWRRRAAIAVGFLGVVIILRPGTDFLQWAALLPLLASLCYACYQVSTRLLSFSEHPLTLFFYTSVVGLAVTTPMALVVWSPMTGIEWLILLFVGFFGFTGQFLLIKAFQFAEASTVAPFIYVQLLFAGFFRLVVVRRSARCLGAARRRRRHRQRPLYLAARNPAFHCGLSGLDPSATCRSRLALQRRTHL